MDELEQNNYAELCGTLAAPPVLSHENRQERFFTFPLETQRLSGTIDRVKEHTQAYYPEWLGERFTFEGTRLPDNIGKAGEKWTMEPFAWGYADNYSTSDRTGMTNRLRISDAVTADGAPANLAQVDFIMVQTGVNAKAPLIGEVSTEVSGIGCYRTVTKKQ